MKETTHIKLNHLDLFNIANTPPHSYNSFGGNQAWYPNFWHKQSGCGPTTAANQMAYLAYTREDYLLLYDGFATDDTESHKAKRSHTTLNKSHFVKHMQRLFDYVTPGMMGVNHINKLSDGVLDYAKSKGGVKLSAHTFSVDPPLTKSSRDVNALKAFVEKGLLNESPIAFLNLSPGDEKRLYPWHWITITEASFSNGKVIATASDEGRIKKFDLSLWYMTTPPKHGGLVYFT